MLKRLLRLSAAKGAKPSNAKTSLTIFPPWRGTAEQLGRAELATTQRFATWLLTVGETQNLTRLRVYALYFEFVDFAELRPLSESAFYRALKEAGICRHRLSAVADGRRPWAYSARRCPANVVPGTF
jgi:hypothetical protein